MIIPIGITAKNEASNLPAFFNLLRQSVEFARQRLNLEFEICVLLNDNTDTSEIFLAAQGDCQVFRTSGGLVAAQRFFKNKHPKATFLIFSDADILIAENCIYEISQEMLRNADLQVAYAEKVPLPPKRKSFLARALYLYNLNNGYQSHRHYFNGQIFAIREWKIPEAHELQWTEGQNNRFLNLGAGIRCDDIFLSRQILQQFGPRSIRCVCAMLWYRAPETLQGMYRKYQRMRLEIERLNQFFPDSVLTHRSWGQRQLSKKTILSRPLWEIFYYGLFLGALQLCKLFYNWERFYYQKFAKVDCPTWKPVLETKDLS